jgi:hypothetical protein
MPGSHQSKFEWPPHVGITSAMAWLQGREHVVAADPCRYRCVVVVIVLAKREESGYTEVIKIVAGAHKVPFRHGREGLERRAPGNFHGDSHEWRRFFASLDDHVARDHPGVARAGPGRSKHPSAPCCWR